MNLFFSTGIPCTVTLAVLLFATTEVTAGVVDFEDLTPTRSYGSDGDTYWNGSDGSGGFESGGAHFTNSFTDWGGGWTSWDGWSYSNTRDTTTSGYENPYSAYTGADQSDTGKNYGVYYKPWAPSVTVTLASGSRISGAYITNTTYAALSMLQGGDGFAKKFGGASGNDEDWFLLTITGWNSSGVTGTVDFYLADYRFSDNALDYIVDEWAWVNLTRLGDATKFAFDLTSSDNDDIYGMNTPAYFALDDLSYSSVPEPGTLAILASGGLVLGAISLVRRRRLKGSGRVDSRVDTEMGTFPEQSRQMRSPSDYRDGMLAST